MGSASALREVLQRPPEVLRRLLRTARLESTVDAQALTEVSRVHADLNRIGGLLKLAIREGVAELRRLINTLSCEGSYITFTSDPCWNL